VNVDNLLSYHEVGKGLFILIFHCFFLGVKGVKGVEGVKWREMNLELKELKE